MNFAAAPRTNDAARHSSYQILTTKYTKHTKLPLCVSYISWLSRRGGIRNHLPGGKDSCVHAPFCVDDPLSCPKFACPLHIFIENPSVIEKILQVFARYKKKADEIEAHLELYGTLLQRFAKWYQPRIDYILHGDAELTSRLPPPAELKEDSAAARSVDRAQEILLRGDTNEWKNATADGMIDPTTAAMKQFDVLQADALTLSLPFGKFVLRTKSAAMDMSNIFTCIQYLRYMEEFVAYSRITAAGASYRDLAGIAFTVNGSKMTGADGLTRLKVDLLIDPAPVEFKTVNGLHAARLRITVFYADAKASYLGQDWKTLDLQLQEDSYQRFLQSGIPFSTVIPLKAAGQILKVVVYDTGSDRVGSKLVKMQ